MISTVAQLQQMPMRNAYFQYPKLFLLSFLALNLLWQMTSASMNIDSFGLPYYYVVSGHSSLLSLFGISFL